jgi:hypothetical protein
VNAINKTGMGPDEYNYVFGIFYDSQDHSLNLLCRHPNKIMKFDKDGNFLLKQVKLPVVLMDLKKSKNGYYAGYAGSSSINNPHSISIFSAEFKLLASEFPNHKEWQMYKIDNTLSSYNGEIYFAPMYGYTIYTVMKKSINPYIRYDFGKYNIPEKIFNDHEQYNGFERNKYIDCIDLFQETNKYLIASYIYQGAQIISFSSKINNTHETYLALNNPISKLGFGNILTMDENHLVTSLEATTVSGILESPEIRASVPEGVDMLKNAMKNPVNEFDDPILCIYHMRQ